MITKTGQNYTMVLLCLMLTTEIKYVSDSIAYDCIGWHCDAMFQVIFQRSLFCNTSLLATSPHPGTQLGSCCTCVLALLHNTLPVSVITQASNLSPLDLPHALTKLDCRLKFKSPEFQMATQSNTFPALATR